MAQTPYLIGRQPIVNRAEELVAYELLFRSPGSQIADVSDASRATASVIVNTLTGFGIVGILGSHQGFINLDLELLMDDALNLLPRDKIVLELLETVPVAPDVIDRCRMLKQNGFTLALDDHAYAPEFEELYAIVDIVKVDLMQSPLDHLEEMVHKFDRYPLQLLAEKVETKEQFLRCLEMGFDLFQGYYFAKPSILEKKRLDDSGATILRLMRQLNEDADMPEIEKTFRGNASLTYKLLLLVNSVGVCTRNKIRTVRHAISILGRQQLKHWIQLALFAGNDSHGLENPLMDLSAVRAGLMEHLAACHQTLRQDPDSGERAFMTGILSVLESAYDIPMEEIIQQLNLSEDVQEALCSQTGILGRLLHVAELLERMDFQHLESHLSELGITIRDVLLAQTKAFNWRKGMAA